MTRTASARADAALVVAISAGGVVGALGRYAVGLALPHTPGRFPWATVVVNVSGALAMGLLVAWLTVRTDSHHLLRPVVGVGILGGWTTFSTYAVDALLLLDAGHPAWASAYVLGSLLGAVLAVGAGLSLGSRVWEDA